MCSEQPCETLEYLSDVRCELFADPKTFYDEVIGEAEAVLNNEHAIGLVEMPSSSLRHVLCKSQTTPNVRHGHQCLGTADNAKTMMSLFLTKARILHRHAMNLPRSVNVIPIYKTNLLTSSAWQRMVKKQLEKVSNLPFVHFLIILKQCFWLSSQERLLAICFECFAQEVINGICFFVFLNDISDQKLNCFNLEEKCNAFEDISRERMMKRVVIATG